MIESLIAIDQKLFFLVNQGGDEFWDSIMLFITHKFSWIPLYLLLVYYIIKQKGKESIWILLSIGLLITLVDQGSVQLFKNHFERLRPCHFLKNVRLVTDGCGGRFGFVSSHAANAFALAVFIGKIIGNRKLFIALFFWATAVAYSRVYVGVHYPLDILCGMLWGTFVALVLFKLYQLFHEKYVQ